MTDGPKLGFVLRVRLDAQTGREDELADRGAEAGEEGVEGLFVARGQTRRTLACSFIHFRLEGLERDSGSLMLFFLFSVSFALTLCFFSCLFALVL